MSVSSDVLSSILARLTRLEEAEEHRRLSSSSFQSDVGSATDTPLNSATGVLAIDHDSPTSLHRLVAEAIEVARHILRQHGGPSDVLLQNQSVLMDLDNVYADIQQFQHRPKQTTGASVSAIPEDLASRWINIFYDAFDSMPSFVPMTREHTFSIPELLQTPYVSIDTSALIIYYNILFQGMIMDENSNRYRATYSSFIYGQCLQLLAIWEERVKPVAIDFYAALLMTWMASEKLDANLAWKVHCRACRVARALGFFMLDAEGEADPSCLNEVTGMTQIDERNRDRYGFWQLQVMDTFFRLHFSKPCIIEPGTWKVDFPDLRSGIRPGVSQQAFEINFIVAMRLAFVALKYFDYIDSHDFHDAQGLECCNQFIDSLVAELDSVLVEWEIDQRFRTATKPIDAWLYADLVFNSKTTAILLYRAKSQMNKQAWIPREPLEAARDTIKFVKQMCSSHIIVANHSMSFISVYPIVSVMTLYTNALQTYDMNEAQDDLALTEWLGATLRAWVEEREELRPVAHVVTALNGVCRQVLSLKGSGGTAHGQKRDDSTNYPRRNDAFIHHLQKSDVELTSLLQDPLDYMKHLELDVYQTDPHAQW